MKSGMNWREVRPSDLNFVGRFWDGDRPDSPMGYTYGVLTEIAWAGPNRYFIVQPRGGPMTFSQGEMQTLQIVQNPDGTLADGLSVDQLADMVRATGEALESQLMANRIEDTAKATNSNDAATDKFFNNRHGARVATGNQSLYSDWI